MKPCHVEAERLNAAMVLRSMNAAAGQDFHTLTSRQLDILGAEADRERYHKPRNANGSRLRYFYDLLQRRAARKGA